MHAYSSYLGQSRLGSDYQWKCTIYGNVGKGQFNIALFRYGKLNAFVILRNKKYASKRKMPQLTWRDTRESDSNIGQLLLYLLRTILK